jgi:hypothetical protein
MLTLPESLAIEVVRSSPSHSGIANVIVMLDFTIDGRYYYGCLAGLTDSAGFVSTSRSAIESSFNIDRQLFPMDFRVELSQCDSRIIVDVPGGEEFGIQKKRALESLIVSDEYRNLWQRATNSRICSVARQVDLGLDHGPTSIRVLIP